MNNDLMRDKILFDKLNEMVEICHKYKAILIFSGYPQEVPALMRKIAELKNIILVDHKPVFDVLLSQYNYEKFFVSDADPHCVSEGYRVMAENIAKKILPLLHN